MPRTLCRDCCELEEGPLDACPACGSKRLVTHTELETLGIAHVDCDAFYAAVEKRDRPELRDRPLIVGHPGSRGVVTTACYIARRSGVRSAMAMFKARQLCPGAVVLPPDMAKYKRVSQDIRLIFERMTDVIEPVSLDEAYLDLTHEHCRADGTAAQALAEIARRIEADIGITVSIGLSCNKFLAKLASEMQKPRGYSVIGRAEARQLLAALPVAKINGVGAATAMRLEEAGIRTIGDLQAMSEMALVARFGRLGRRLAHFAAGEDDRPVSPARETKSVSAETTLEQDTASVDVLLPIAARLAERVEAALVRKGLAGGAVVVKLKTADFRIMTRARRLQAPTQRAEVMMDAARLLLARAADGTRFRLVGIGVDRLVPQNEADPPDLFR